MRGARCPIVRSLLLCMGLAGCGGAGDDLALPTAPITRLDGELHLHEFPAGAHAWAGFIAGAVPLVDVHSDQLVELDTAPTAADGAC
ncbi:MAG TPA: hypothetical protein VE987_10675, partial [Polyangiaceae bacterium]|nr:hypothetical protein [Polyangiaceae bacterium]